jgi:hypothetical protein
LQTLYIFQGTSLENKDETTKEKWEEEKELPGTNVLHI